jgi:hypothetical protein
MWLPSLAVLVAACAEAPEIRKPRSEMTQRERDSTIAESGLPGAGVVKRAMSIADAEARRAAAFDSVSEP